MSDPASQVLVQLDAVVEKYIRFSNTDNIEHAYPIDNRRTSQLHIKSNRGWRRANVVIIITNIVVSDSQNKHRNNNRRTNWM